MSDGILLSDHDQLDQSRAKSRPDSSRDARAGPIGFEPEPDGSRHAVEVGPTGVERRENERLEHRPVAAQGMARPADDQSTVAYRRGLRSPVTRPVHLIEIDPAQRRRELRKRREWRTRTGG